MVVAIEEEAGTMELVTAGASCNIDGPACSGSSTQIKVGGGDLKFLHRFLREAHCGSTISDLHDAATIHGNARCASVHAHGCAQQGHYGSIVAYFRWLLRPGLELCDREGLAAYLESSKESNLAFYGRFGFRVTDEVRMPGGGPPVWLMWRDPA